MDTATGKFYPFSYIQDQMLIVVNRFYVVVFNM